MNKVMKSIFVPGRLCILGEHTDWIGEYISANPSLCNGYTLVCATNEGLFADVSSFTSNKLKYSHVSSNPNDESVTIEVDLDIEALKSRAQEGGFFSYIFGTAAIILQNASFRKRITEIYSTNEVDPTMSGIFINNHKTTLPMQKGLSSSAAICVLTILAFQAQYAITTWTQAEIMEMAYLGEMLTPSHCGRMDQCVVMGPHAIGLMTFHNTDCQLHILPCATSLYFVIVDLKASKDTIVILRDLNACFPHASNTTQALMHDYAHEIKHIALSTKEAIVTGDITTIAKGMKDAQISFDRCAIPNCPSQLTAPKLHQLMTDEYLNITLGVLAIKGIGSQGDGSAQILCSNSYQQEEVLKYLSTHYGMDGFCLTIQGGTEKE